MDAGSSLPLRAFYQRDFAPLFLTGARPRTFDAYTGTISRWELHTDNPAIAAIDNRALAQFKSNLNVTADTTSAATLSPATINKHLRHVRAMLLAAGPPSPTNPEGLSLIERVPYTRPMPEEEPQPTDVDDQAIAAFYAAATRARLPATSAGYDAAPWWRALIAAAYFLAARRGTLLALTWANVDVAGATIRYAGHADKCGRARSKPIHPALLAHLVAIRVAGGRVFAWPHSDSTWYREFRRLQGLAGVRFKLHDLKRTAATNAADVLTVFELKDLCDHSTVRTTERFYVRRREQQQRDAIKRLPVPTAFLPHQLRLFD